MDGDDVKRVEGFVPNERMSDFLRKVEHMQVLAAKLGLPAWTVTVGDKEWRQVHVLSEDAVGATRQRTMQLEGRPIAIEGVAPVLGDWRFVAKIEHDAGGNLVKGFGDAPLPVEWHSCGPGCEHCGVDRQRLKTYMLRHVESGNVKQVGSTCVADFTGEHSRDPDRIMGMYEYLSEIGREFLDDPDELGRCASMNCFGVPPVKLMAAVLKIVQEDGGYISAEKAEAQCVMSTGERLRAAFWGRKPIEVVPDAGHVERAPNVVDWLRGQREADSVWLRNIGVLASRDAVLARDAGLFGSGFIAWNRELEKQLRAENGEGAWIGSGAGDKVSLRATLERCAGYETQYGFRNIFTFRDEEGNALVWKTQAPPRGMIVGTSYGVLATVKEHGEYHGERQTEVVRAKLAEIELFSFGALAGFKKMAAIASADVVDERGLTPLVQAVWGDKVEHAKVLLAAGADANQWNQGEIPVLAYATSGNMAEVLIAAGARVQDVGERELGEMVLDARKVVERERAGPATWAIADRSHPMACGVVTEGTYSGRILEVADGVAVQKVGRGDTETVRHAIERLEGPVAVGMVVDVIYRQGRGVIEGVGASREVGR